MVSGWVHVTEKLIPNDLYKDDMIIWVGAQIKWVAVVVLYHYQFLKCRCIRG